MPFGLAKGPSHFQRVIYSKNLTELVKHLELVFKHLDQFGLQIKPEKCKFALDEIKLLGFVLNREGIRANPDKTSAISSMPPSAHS